MKMRRVISTLCVLLTAGVAQAQEAAPAPEAIIETPSYLPPSETVQDLLNQAPVVQRAKAMLDAAQAVGRARRAGPHEFTVGGEYVSRDIKRDGRYSEWSAGVSRGIRLPGKYEADGKIAKYGVSAAMNGYEDARHRAALSLKDLWIAWLAAEENAGLTAAEVKNYERQLVATIRSRELGTSATLDVEQVQAALAQARVQATQAQQARHETKVMLRHTFPELALPANPAVLPEPVAPHGDWESWRSAVIARSHEMKMAQSEADRREWLARRYRLDRFADPTVGLRAFQERGGDETGFGVSISIPIGGTLRSAEADAAKAEATAALVDARRVAREIEINARRDIIQAQEGLTAWRQSQQAVKNGTAMLGRMQRAFALGDKGLMEVLIAQRQVFEIRRGELRARAAANSAVLQLLIDAHSIWGLGED